MMNKKIILVPYPAQGHVTPMLKLASVLSNFGFKPIIITPEYIHRRISTRVGILSLSIPDGLDEETPRDFFAIERAMEKYMPVYLEELVWKMENDDDAGGGIACFVVDLLASWAIKVAERCGVAAVGFWPAMHATYRLIEAIPHLMRTGIISENGCPQRQNTPICLSPNGPILSTNDLPWLIGSSTARSSRFKFWTRTLQRSKSLRWILTNTFPGECQQSESQYSTIFSRCSSPQVLEIGPLLMQVTNMSNASFWDEEVSCLNWLDEQSVGSVIYISFGSWVSPIGEEKVKSLALALEILKKPFLWVLGPAWRSGLPDEYVKRNSKRGRVVSWAPQLEVLQHQAVGCYLTHCGWNSTMEGIQCQKPMLCYPIAGDQFLNCQHIVNAWKIGVKLEGFDVKEVEDGIKRAVENDQRVGRRLERLNDKLFGEEGTSSALANLSILIQDLGQLTMSLYDSQVK